MDALGIIALGLAGSGGSGGGVTKQYVDEHLALKADKTETAKYSISSSASGTSFALTDATDGHLQNLKIKGATDSTTGASVGDGGSITITTTDGTKSTSATLTTGMPLCSLSESLTDEVDMLAGVAKRCCGVDLGEVEWTYQAFDVPRFVGILPHICMPNEWLNFICNSSEYIADTSPLTGTNVDKTIMIYNITSTQCLVMIHDFDYMDATLFKNHVNGVKLVYGLATPYDLPLTSAEMSALTNIKTYTGTTNITCTDSPQMIVDYLINTDNGMAVGNIQQQFINTVPLSMIAPAFSTSETYAVGDFVIYNFVLYKCTTAVQTAGAWNAANWTASTVADMLTA